MTFKYSLADTFSKISIATMSASSSSLTLTHPPVLPFGTPGTLPRLCWAEYILEPVLGIGLCLVVVEGLLNGLEYE